MKLRQWLGLFILLAGGFGTSQEGGIEYFIASIILIIIGLLLIFIPSKKKDIKK